MLVLAFALMLAEPLPPAAPAARVDDGDAARLVLPAVNLGASALALGLAGTAAGFGAGRTAAAFGASLLGLGAGALLNVALFSPAAVVDVNDSLAPGVMLLPFALLAPVFLGGAEAIGGHGFGPAGALGLAAVGAAGGIALGLLENLFVDFDGTFPVALTAVLLSAALTTCAYAAVKGP